MNEVLEILLNSPQFWACLFLLAMAVVMLIGADRQVRRERAAKQAKATAAQAN